MDSNYLTEGGFQLIQNISNQFSHKNSPAAKDIRAN